MSRILTRTAAALAFGLVMTAPVPTAGQSFWLGPTMPDGLTLEAAHPELKSGFVDLAPYSMAYFASVRATLRPGIRLVAEVPFVHASWKSELGDPDESSSSIGNPYVGVEWLRSATQVELGLRLPLASDDEWAVGIGWLADMDRMEAFMPDVLTASARVAAMLRPEGSPFALRLQGGPSLLVYTGDEDGFRDSAELLVSYGAQAIYELGKAELVGGLSGRGLVTESGDFSERTFHHLGLAASIDLGAVRPGLVFRLPLDDDLDDVKFIAGFHLTVPLRR